MAQIVAGRRLGPYELQEIIGQGGVGVVYRAYQAGAARDVAIKVVGEPYARHPAFVHRFKQEAQASARLLHPHILPVYDVGVGDGQPYIVTAYLPGGTLAARIAANPGGLPLPEVVRMTAQLAAALDYAHAQGIVHRDLKPGNVLLDGHGNAYLSDFGIARLAEREGLEIGAPGGEPPGTRPYMAPEVRAGADATPASDIFALGVMAFEMLAGRRPFTQDEAGRLLREQGANPLNVRLWRSDVPDGVRIALEQALSADPAARPPLASALALARASRDLLSPSEASLPLAATPEVQRSQTPPPLRAFAPADEPSAGPQTPTPDLTPGPPPAEPTAPPTAPARLAAGAVRTLRRPGMRPRREVVLGWAITAALLAPLVVLLVLLLVSLGQQAGF